MARHSASEQGDAPRVAFSEEAVDATRPRARHYAEPPPGACEQQVRAHAQGYSPAAPSNGPNGFDSAEPDVGPDSHFAPASNPPTRDTPAVPPVADQPRIPGAGFGPPRSTSAPPRTPLRFVPPPPPSGAPAGPVPIPPAVQPPPPTTRSTFDTDYDNSLIKTRPTADASAMTQPLRRDPPPTRRMIAVVPDDDRTVPRNGTNGVPIMLATYDPVDVETPFSDDATRAHPPVEDPRAGRRWVRSTLWLVAVVIISMSVAFVVRTYAVQSFWIPSASMEPTLHGCPGCNDDRVLVDKLSYHLHTINRGDVVVFHRPPSVPVEDNYLIKRVIGLPGETVSGRGGSVIVNGRALTEPYVNPACQGTESFDAVVVPAGRVFLMGDNRCESLDSRVFGTVAQSSVIGRAFIRIWPLGRVHWL